MNPFWLATLAAVVAQPANEVAEEFVTVHGTVVDSNGKPFGAATVRLMRADDPLSGRSSEWLGEPVAVAEDGTFAIDVPADEDAVSIVAEADGYAPDACPVSRRRGVSADGASWSDAPDAKQFLSRKLLLHPAVARSLRMVDLRGEPVEGATLAYAYGTRGIVGQNSQRPIAGPALPGETFRSDADGRITVDRLPAGGRLNVHRASHPDAAGSDFRTNASVNEIGDEPVRDEPMFDITLQDAGVPVRFEFPAGVARVHLRAAGNGGGKPHYYSHEWAGAVEAGVVEWRLPPGVAGLTVRRVDVASADKPLAAGRRPFAFVEAAAADREHGPWQFDVTEGRVFTSRVYPAALVAGEMTVDSEIEREIKAEQTPFEKQAIAGTLLAAIPEPVVAGEPPTGDWVMVSKTYPSDRLGRMFSLGVPATTVTLAYVSSARTIAEPFRRVVDVPITGTTLPDWPVVMRPSEIRGRVVDADEQPVPNATVTWPRDINPPTFGASGGHQPIRSFIADETGRFVVPLHERLRLNDFARHNSVAEITVTLTATGDQRTGQATVDLGDPAAHEDVVIKLDRDAME